MFRFFSTTDSDAANGFDTISEFEGIGNQPAGVVKDVIDVSGVYSGTLTVNGTTAGGMGTLWLENVGKNTWVHINTDANAAAEISVQIADGTSFDASMYTAGDFVP
ncbi:hypothetical protein RGQ15_07245 [Paracoccus sp. MBLB3053]|uniref:Uncharacterized protein n=1 Tax=Paracoccus aurantius TaxID=3073814 RepID=A0ABU2HQP1_9RHOB|nr:hypothetical protein [Paracoccus sp. MBLB3053]MDS9467369.1 hypothetical protein [Paracoccus sp. MBLB3053]